METRLLPDPARAARMNTSELRQSFLVSGLFAGGETRLVYTLLDRMIIGSVVPVGGRLELTGDKQLASDYFAERREAGITTLAEGSVWNTVPAHTHLRRVEAYLYFDLAPEAVVFHLMGQPAETRHLVVRDGQAVLSPSWSIHCGCGTGKYSFVWAMGGENQAFDDMDVVAMDELR